MKEATQYARSLMNDGCPFDLAVLMAAAEYELTESAIRRALTTH